MADARKAVELAPGSADVAELAGFVLTPSGYPEEGVIQSEKAIALNPNYPAVYLGISRRRLSPMRGEPSKRLPPLRPIMREAPDSA